MSDHFCLCIVPVWRQPCRCSPYARLHWRCCPRCRSVVSARRSRRPWWDRGWRPYAARSGWTTVHWWRLAPVAALERTPRDTRGVPTALVRRRSAKQKNEARTAHTQKEPNRSRSSCGKLNPPMSSYRFVQMPRVLKRSVRRYIHRYLTWHTWIKSSPCIISYIGTS